MSRKTDHNKRYKKLKSEYLKLWSENALYSDALKEILDDKRTKDIAEDLYKKYTKLLPSIDRHKELMRLDEILGNWDD